MQFKSLLFPILTAVLIAGCGGGNPAQPVQAVSKLAGAARCLNCHATAVSPGTGALVTDEWKASAHNLQNGAGCADCHEPAADHPNQCSTCHGGGEFQVTVNPDASGKCLKCHGPSFPGDVMMSLAPQHFGYSTARVPGATRASFVSGQYQGRCRACHNPHLNTLTQQHRDYARSLHGDPKGVAWNHYEFKQDAFAACTRCHTSTGFKAFVTSGFTVPTKGFGAGDPSRELLACDACHTSYDFKNSVRQVAAFTAPYTVAGRASSFPDTGTSNLCIPCHSGRLSADDVAAVADFTNAPFVSPHYLAAAGLMYMKIGFTGFTTASAPANAATPAAAQFSYGDSYTLYTGKALPAAPAGQVNSAHRRFGTPLINDDNHTAGNSKGLLAAWLPGTMDTGGPCATCHLNAADSNGLLSTNSRTTSHTLAINTNTFNQVCVNCHYADVAPTAVTPANVRAFLDDNGSDFRHAVALAQQVLLSKYQISYTTVYPYFYDLAADPTGAKAVTDWTRGTGDQAFGRRMMGACFNINLLDREPAAYVHARTYARRLIYDTIDFLDDGSINMSVGATATALDSIDYVKGTTTTDSSRAFNYLCNLTQPERK